MNFQHKVYHYRVEYCLCCCNQGWWCGSIVCGICKTCQDTETTIHLWLPTYVPSNTECSMFILWNILALTHWGRVTHICVGNLTIIGSDNGLSPGRRQAISWTNVGILLIGPLGTHFSEMLIEIHAFSLKKIHLKMSSGKWRPFCLGLNVLNLKLVIETNMVVSATNSIV